MKPGIKSTEFWLTKLAAIIGPLIAILVVTGILSPDTDQGALAETVTSNVDAIVGGVVALVGVIGSVIATRGYSKDRTNAKIAELENAPTDDHEA